MRLSSLLSAATLMVAGTSAFAQSTTLPAQNVGARVVVPIVITKDPGTPQVDGQDLYFGRFLSPASAGTITLTPDNTASFTGGVTATLNNTTPRYNITASNGMALTVTIAFPATVINGAQNMALSNPRFAVAGAAGAGTASGGGFTYTAAANYIRIGGTLAVAASQADGLYTNTYSVTVAYN